MSIDLKEVDPGFASIRVGFQSGSGAPSFAASKGTIYVNLAGSSTNDRMYVNTDGSTTWTAFTTAA